MAWPWKFRFRLAAVGLGVEDADLEAAPAAAVERFAQELLLLGRLAVDGHRKRVVAHGRSDGVAVDPQPPLGGRFGVPAGRGAARVPPRVGREETDPRAARRRRPGRLDHGGRLASGVVVGLELDLPAHRCAVQSGRDCRGRPGQCVHPHAGGVLAVAGVVGPPASSEGEQRRRILDPGPVVGDAQPAVVLGGDLHRGRAGAPRVLQDLLQRLLGARVEEARHLVDRAGIDAGTDLCLVLHVGSLSWRRTAPGLPVAVGL